MTFDAQCGIRLKEERERLGLSQQEIADRVSIRREMWSRYERGQAAPGGDALTAFLRMGGDLIYVLTGESESAPTTADEHALLDTYRKLDVRAKAGVLGMVAGFNSEAPASAPASSIEGSGNYVVQGNHNRIASESSQIGSEKKKKP